MGDTLIYFKYFILYSLLGFIYESTLFKICHINKHSGVLYGPYTLVYGLGGSICTFIFQKWHLTSNIFLFLIFLVICTLIEFITGHLIRIIYKFDSWNYSYKKYHFGNYICLSYAIVWGLMALVLVKFFNPFLYQIMKLIPNNITIYILFIIIIDIIVTYIKTK